MGRSAAQPTAQPTAQPLAQTVQTIEGATAPNTTVYDTGTLWMGWTAILVPILLLVSYRIHRTNKVRRYHLQVANLERMWLLSTTSRES